MMPIANWGGRRSVPLHSAHPNEHPLAPQWHRPHLRVELAALGQRFAALQLLCLDHRLELVVEEAATLGHV